MPTSYMMVLGLIGAAALIGAFVEDAGRKQRDRIEKLETKVDQILRVLENGTR